tara:strand:- start:1483 stop:1731 length:249 start_codon:yes stop_codon:yes gene_type:complete
MFDNGQIKMYGRDSCGYTVEMKNKIEKSSHKHMFHYIDVNSPEGKKEYKKLRANGVPAFHFKGKTVVGAMPMEILLKNLNVS